MISKIPTLTVDRCLVPSSLHGRKRTAGKSLILTSSPVNVRVLKEKQNVTNKRKEKQKTNAKSQKLQNKRKVATIGQKTTVVFSVLKNIFIRLGRIGSCANCEQNDVARRIQAVSQAQESLFATSADDNVNF